MPSSRLRARNGGLAPSLRAIIEREGEVNGERLVLVDGLGDKTLVPIDSLSGFARRVNRRRRIRRLMKRLERDGASASRSVMAAGLSGSLPERVNHHAD